MSGNVVAWVFDRFPVHGARDRTLKTVLSEIAEAANRDFENAHPGIRSICEHWGFSRSTVIDALNVLVADGWLEITEAGGGRGRATVYRICRERVRPPDGSSPRKGPDPEAKGSSFSSETVQIPDSSPSLTPKNSPVGAVAPAPLLDAVLEAVGLSVMPAFGDPARTEIQICHRTLLNLGRTAEDVRRGRSAWRGEPPPTARQLMNHLTVLLARADSASGGRSALDISLDDPSWDPT